MAAGLPARSGPVCTWAVGWLRASRCRVYVKSSTLNLSLHIRVHCRLLVQFISTEVKRKCWDAGLAKERRE